MRKIEITNKEWRFVAIVAAVAIGVTYLPYLYAKTFVPDTKVFMGIMLDVPDHGQYFSWMRGFSTKFLVENKLTPEPNSAVFFNLLWWGLARLNNLFDFGFAGAIQILRVAGGGLFILASYVCASLFSSDLRFRKLSLLGITFGSGLGWIWVVEKYLFGLSDVRFPLDIYVAEGNSFLSLLGYPHFIAAALYISVFWFILKAFKTDNVRYAVAGGLLGQFWGWQHAYDLWIIYAVMGAFFLLLWIRDVKFPKKMFKIAFVVGMLSFPPGLYSFLLTSIDPLWKRILAQFANAGVFTPPPLHLVILMGIPLILAIMQVVFKEFFDFRNKSDIELFILGWFLISFVLIYMPVDYQIHMLNGWQIPITLLAVKLWLDTVEPYLISKFNQYEKIGEKSFRIILNVILISIILPANVYIFLWRFIELRRFDYPYFLHVEEVEALQWLESNVKDDSIVLSSLEIGQFIPAWSGKTAFLAHWAQTVDFYDKEKFVQGFFSGDQVDENQKEVLNRFSVDYVFWGPLEKAAGIFQPNYVSDLALVFSNDLVQIYEWVGD
jgi:hypothetical protein